MLSQCHLLNRHSAGEDDLMIDDFPSSLAAAFNANMDSALGIIPIVETTKQFLVFIHIHIYIYICMDIYVYMYIHIA